MTRVWASRPCNPGWAPKARLQSSKNYSAARSIRAGKSSTKADPSSWFSGYKFVRIALLGGFDTFLFRGVERPLSHSYYRLSPGLNLARGFAELGTRDIHYLVVTPEVDRLTVDEGPFGKLHRIP